MHKTVRPHPELQAAQSISGYEGLQSRLTSTLGGFEEAEAVMI